MSKTNQPSSSGYEWTMADVERWKRERERDQWVYVGQTGDGELPVFQLRRDPSIWTMPDRSNPSVYRIYRGGTMYSSLSEALGVSRRRWVAALAEVNS